jgi:hypothetical protein
MCSRDLHGAAGAASGKPGGRAASVVRPGESGRSSGARRRWALHRPDRRSPGAERTRDACTAALRQVDRLRIYRSAGQDKTFRLGSLPVNLDGTGYKPVVQHESDNVFYASPRFDKPGNILYFHRRAAIIQNGSYVGNEDSLERLDLRTGERKRLLMDGADPTISPTGDRIVYTHLTQGYPDAIWTANIDGSNARPFFKTKDPWWYLQTPRFAPSPNRISPSRPSFTSRRATARA